MAFRGFKYEATRFFVFFSKYLFFWADFFNPWPTSLPVDTMPHSKTSRESNCCIQVWFTSPHGPCRYNGRCSSSAGSAYWAVPELPEAGRSQHEQSCRNLWHPLWQTGKTSEQLICYMKLKNVWIRCWSMPLLFLVHEWIFERVDLHNLLCQQSSFFPFTLV